MLKELRPIQNSVKEKKIPGVREPAILSGKKGDDSFKFHPDKMLKLTLLDL